MRVVEYQLYRDREQARDDGMVALNVVTIRVKRRIDIDGGNFLAVPERGVIGGLRFCQAYERFHGIGASEDEALRDCVEKIGITSFSDLFSGSTPP